MIVKIHHGHIVDRLSFDKTAELYVFLRLVGKIFKKKAICCSVQLVASTYACNIKREMPLIGKLVSKKYRVKFI